MTFVFPTGSAKKVTLPFIIHPVNGEHTVSEQGTHQVIVFKYSDRQNI